MFGDLYSCALCKLCTLFLLILGRMHKADLNPNDVLVVHIQEFIATLRYGVTIKILELPSQNNPYSTPSLQLFP